MSNTITIELCQEDRARVDRLIAALERRTCDKCVASALEFVNKAQPEQASADPVQQKLAETLAKASQPVEAPKNATGAAEASTPTTTPPEEETPKEDMPAQPATAKTVNQKDVRAKYVELAASGKKEDARAILLSYATAISAIPDDKCQEVYDKLVALEG